MVLPMSLQEISTTARTSILSHPQGELILPIRVKIWNELGPFLRDNDSRAIITTGLKRRVLLATLCIEKTIHVWEEVIKDDHRPRELLCLASDYLKSQISFTEVKEKIGRFPTDLDDLGINEFYSNATLVGFASLRTMELALKDEQFLSIKNTEYLDSDFDPYNWDASFFSALVYSGSGPWDNNNIEKRREFWTWYIDEAVPKAYLAYQD